MSSVFKPTENNNQDMLIQLPLLPAQQSLWHMHNFSPKENAFTTCKYFRTHRRYNRGSVILAYEQLQLRHPLLRATFEFNHSGLLQIIHKNPLSAPVWIDSEDDENAIKQQIQSFVKTPFDIEKGPLTRLHACETDTCLFLCLSAHNIIVDHYSLNLISNELYLLLEGKQLEPLSEDQCIEILKQEIDGIKNCNEQKHITFYQQMLANTPVLQIPSDHPRAKIRPLQGRSHTIDFGPDIRKNIFSTAAALNVLPVDLLTATFVALLNRYSNQDDIVIGTTSDTRRRGTLQEYIAGPFSNEIPVRIKNFNKSTFKELITRIVSCKNDSSEHLNFPFSSLVEKLAPERNICRPPVFQASINLSDEPADLQWHQILLGSEEGQVDLSCALFDMKDSLLLQMRSSEDIFSKRSLKTIAERFKLILEQFISNPDLIICKSSLLSADEINQLTSQSIISTVHQMNSNSTVLDLFSKQVSSRSEHTAVMTKYGSFTYSEIDTASNAVACYLCNTLNLKKGTRVGVYIDRSHYLFTSLWGILKSGCVYVPLDPSFPPDRINYMIQDADIRVIITAANIDKKLDLFDGTVINLDDPVTNNSKPSLAQKQQHSPEDIAYIIYTSGSTGHPKGVEIYHGALFNFIQSMIYEPGIFPTDIFCALTTFSFDISLLELLGPLCAGATCVILDKETCGDAIRLAESFSEFQATITQATPATWNMLISSGWKGRKTMRILCGGEQLSHDLGMKLLKCGDQVWNMYGPTETTIWSSCRKLNSNDTVITVGKPIDNTTFHILDNEMQPLPWGIPGNLYIGGCGVAAGYVNLPEMTAERFIHDPFPKDPEARLYATGDLACFQPDGEIIILGRNDSQIKLNGFRIECEEIETVLQSHPHITNAVVVLQNAENGEPLLAAHCTSSGQQPDKEELRNYCIKSLPAYMVPSRFKFHLSLPLTPNGKIDRKALPVISMENEPHNQQTPPRTEIEKQLAQLWQKLLSIATVGIHDNFFDLGGTSITASLAAAELRTIFSLQDFSVIKIFNYPTINALASFISSGRKSTEAVLVPGKKEYTSSYTGAIAVIGLAGRFPEADSVDQMWANLCQGKETVTYFNKDNLHPSISARLRNNPDYIGARGILSDIDKFDAAFFGIRPKEAEIMDPQQRVFLEVAWAALENAGYSSDTYDGSIGVYAGMGNNTYFKNNISTHPELIELVGDLPIEIGTEKDHIAPRVSYAMNLHGPSLSIHTACSTTLVVIDNAFHALRSFQCDMAIAGGIDIHVPQQSGQIYQDGGIFTKDGHCRPFDAQATGTMFGEGAGAIVLKRLEDAIAANDTINAVIIGSAVNHDGSRKVSYLAPSATAQEELIVKALSVANITPDSIGYIEAHGTATPIGDPIELEALTNAYRRYTSKKQYCAIGSIKGNWGHATTAAGISSFIKVVQVMKNGIIPPSINYSQPNPHIDFVNSPFFVNTTLSNWPQSLTPRRAGISSFGFCGTNAHLIVEEPPIPEPSSISLRPRHLLLLSAKTPSALARMSSNLSDYCQAASSSNIADIAYTLQLGRKSFTERSFYVVEDHKDILQMIAKPDPNRFGIRKCTSGEPEVVFLFPGQGSQYVNMGKSFYRDEPLFKNSVDTCATILKPLLNRDIRELFYPDDNDRETVLQSLNETFYTQPAIFTIEYSLAQLWMSWGIHPQAMIGHSIGEFVCACIAGVFSLEDALSLVAARGRLMQQLPRGSMLSVRLPYDTLKGLLPENIDIAAINGPELCVVSGEEKHIAEFAARLEQQQIVCRYLHSSHAFHSRMMDSVVTPFEQYVRNIKLNKPELPFVSTVTGTWMTDTDALSSLYWAQHLRKTVRFSDAILTVWQNPSRVLLEVGPRATAATLARQHMSSPSSQFAIPSLSDSADNESEWNALLKAMGMLWLAGITPDWQAFYKDEKRKRIALPTYSFEKTRFWVEPTVNPGNTGKKAGTNREEPPMDTNTKNEQKGSIELLTKKLQTIVQDISGVTLPETAFNTTFLELGLDSLVLTQISRALANEFSTKISFGRLMDDISTINILATHLRTVVPEVISAMDQGSPALPDTEIETQPETQHQTEHQPVRNSSLEALVIKQAEIIERLVKILESHEQKASSGQQQQIIETPLLKDAKTQENTDITICRADQPPVPDARLGRDENGNAAWYIPDPLQNGNFKKWEPGA